jgi:hypothetical protein
VFIRVSLPQVICLFNVSFSGPWSDDTLLAFPSAGVQMKYTVLFLSGTNGVQSPMAEALLNVLDSDHF